MKSSSIRSLRNVMLAAVTSIAPLALATATPAHAQTPCVVTPPTFTPAAQGVRISAGATCAEAQRVHLTISASLNGKTLLLSDTNVNVAARGTIRQTVFLASPTSQVCVTLNQITKCFPR